MAIVTDTSIVYALMDRADASHGPVVQWWKAVEEELVTTPLAVAEMDYLVTRIGGTRHAAALRRDLTQGAYIVDWWPSALVETVSVADRHDAMGLGLVDASLVALAGRLKTTRIATLDERHFRVLAPLTGEPAFTLFPADA